MKKREILISNPASLYLTFLPYIFGVLKHYAEEEPIIRENYDWLDPIYQRGSARSLLKPYDLSSIDVLGLSCYVWNFLLQCEIAEIVKRENPRCLIVMGGPEPNWKDGNFFSKHPYVDLVVRQDGEIPFREILKERTKDAQANYKHVPSLIFKDDDQVFISPEIKQPKVLTGKSPYCDEPLMEKIISKSPPGSHSVIWETNRGCPYSCVFCDWGSNTFSKLRKFPEDKIEREIQWFAQHKINRVYITDANFGILERDEVIVDNLVQIKKKSGWPLIVDWCAAKNHIDRIERICLKLHDSGLNRGVLIGYQTTDEGVLQIMQRMNLSLEKHRQLAINLRKNGVHVFGAVILGSPGENLESFKKTLHDLLDMGFHESIRCYLYALLPNAPANHRDYLEEHEVVIKRAPIVGPVESLDELFDVHYPRIDYVVGHSCMDRISWTQKCLYYALISGFHNLGLTRALAYFLKENRNISYGEFYESLFDFFNLRDNFYLSSLFGRLTEKLRSFLDQENEHFFILEDDHLFEHEKWLYIHAIENIEVVFKEIEFFLNATWGLDDQIRDLLSFQEFSILPLHWPSETQKLFKYDWLLMTVSDLNLSNVLKEGRYQFSYESHFLKEHNWLKNDDFTIRKRKYVHEVLGSMIYKKSNSMVPLVRTSFS